MAAFGIASDRSQTAVYLEESGSSTCLVHLNKCQLQCMILPAMSTDNSALIAVLDGLASNVQQALGPFIAVLIHMEV